MFFNYLKKRIIESEEQKHVDKIVQESGNRTRVKQIKEFINFDESEVNNFLKSLKPEFIVDIKYSITTQKGWNREGLDPQDESYETSEIVNGIVILYWADYPQGTSKN